MEVGKLDFPAIQVDGRRRSARVTSTTEYLGSARIISATLNNKTGFDLWAVLIDGPRPGPAVVAADWNIFAVITAGDGALPAPYWSEPNGRATPDGFTVVFLDAYSADSTINADDADPSGYAPSFLDVSYEV